MKIKHYLLTAITALTLAGCYDDDKLWNAVDEQEQRLETLEKWQKQVNSNIEALQTLVNGQDYITGVTAVTLAGDTIGYTIAFHSHEAVTIYYGAKGDKGDKGDTGDKGAQGDSGATPVVSVVQEADGNWYWTLNGELLKDAAGKPIRANGIDGADGRPGADGTPGANGNDGRPAPAPQLKSGQALTDAGIVCPTGTWTAEAIYLSVDGGAAWTKVSGDNGKHGDAWLSGIDTNNEDYVTFELAGQGGAVIQVPRYKALALAFTYNPFGTADETLNPNVVTGLIPDAANRATLSYQITGVSDQSKIKLAAFLTAGKGWTAAADNGARTITLTLPPANDADADKSAVLSVSITDNAGQSRLYVLQLRRTFGEAGTETEPYLISSAYELEYLAQKAVSTSYTDKFFLLTDDIDLKGKEWTPIGRDQYGSTLFHGTFDGGGHRISGLKVNRNDEYAGLFAWVGSGATLRNITLVKPSVETSEGNCGALAGVFDGKKIENCRVEGGTCTARYIVGGLVGYIYADCELTNCRVDGMTLTATDEIAYNEAGGLVGYICNKTVTFTQCCATNCTINAAKDACGGLVGSCIYAPLNLYGCYATGTITGYGKALGGLVGRFEEGNTAWITMSGCYSQCQITDQSKTLNPETELSLVGKLDGGYLSISNYYLTTVRTDVTNVNIQQSFRQTFDAAMIAAMNTAVKAMVKTEPYNNDGTFKQE